MRIFFLRWFLVPLLPKPQEQVDNALASGVEWKAKYQQEHVKANGLVRDLSAKEDELRELKRERGLDTDLLKLGK